MSWSVPSHDPFTAASSPTAQVYAMVARMNGAALSNPHTLRIPHDSAANILTALHRGEAAISKPPCVALDPIEMGLPDETRICSSLEFHELEAIAVVSKFSLVAFGHRLPKLIYMGKETINAAEVARFKYYVDRLIISTST